MKKEIDITKVPVEVQLISIIKDRIKKLEEKEDIKFDESFKIGFTAGFLEAIEYSEEQVKNN